jgi:tetratricopeptide (TPR) repeat protein
LGEAAKARVPVILSTVASNLRDSGPFASVRRELGANEQSVWDKALTEGAALEAAGLYADAIPKYEEAARLDPAFAEIPFRTGTSYLGMGDPTNALASFVRARDLDALPLRTDSRLNQIISQAANGRSGVFFVDAEQMLAQASTNHVPGNDYFYEHVHLRLEGNYELGRAFAQRIEPLLPANMKQGDRGRWLSLEDCERALGWNPWAESRSFEHMVARIGIAPFTNQISHSAQLAFYRAKITELKARMVPEALPEALLAISNSVVHFPEDPFLHEQYARLLEQSGQNTNAVAEWRRCRDLLPNYAGSYVALARLYLRDNKLTEARQELAIAVKLRPEAPEVLNEYARLLIQDREPQAAIALLAKAQRLAPNLAEVQLNLALAQERAGRTNEALRTCLNLLSNKSNNVPAHFAAARLLTAGGDWRAGADHLREVIQIQPADASAYIELANLLASHGQRQEGVQVLERAVQLIPHSWEARYLLGVEYGAQNRFNRAEAQFAEVVMAKPDFVLAHLNLGVSLAKQSRFDEALARFTETLRLDPSNRQAQQYVALIRKTQGAAKN